MPGAPIQIHGKTVVLTGTFTRPRKDLEQRLTALGAGVKSSVSAKTDLVFAGAGAGSKLEMAQAYRVRICSEQELMQVLGLVKGPPLALPDAGASPAAFLATLQAIPWGEFDAERDGAGLRDRLLEQERQHGLHEAHRYATAQIRAKPDTPMPLQHAAHHDVDIGSVGMSPDGRWLATGSWVGDDYDRGGDLMVWDMAAGRPVGSRRIAGGVGWPDYPAQIQWRPAESAPDQRIGLGHDTNGVGVVSPFRLTAGFDMLSYITDGWSRPPAWTWSPDGRQIYVACWGPSLSYGAFVDATIERPKPRWAAPASDASGEPTLEPFAEAWWPRMDLLLGWSNHRQLVRIDPPTGAIRWSVPASQPCAMSPDGTQLVMSPGGLVWYDPETGLPLPDQAIRHTGSEALIFSPDSRWLAALVTEENAEDSATVPGVLLYEAGSFRSTVALPPAHADREQPGPAFAWSPDSRCFAVLSGAAPERAIHVWRLCEGGPPEEFCVLAAPGAIGLFWGATLAACGPETVQFFSPHRLPPEIGSFHPLLSSSGPNPLAAPGLPEHGAAQTFPLDREQRAAFFLDALYGPATLTDAPGAAPVDYDRYLTRVLAGRIAWPLRWELPPRYDSLEAAARAKAPGLPAPLIRQFTKQPLHAAKTKTPKTWPPLSASGPKTVLDLAAMIRADLALLQNSWYRTEAACRLGRSLWWLGEREEALRTWCAPDGSGGVTGRLEAALRQEDPAAGRAWVEEAEALLMADAPQHRSWGGLIGLAAARYREGDTARAEELLAPIRARQVYNGAEQSFAGWALWRAGHPEAFATCYRNSHPWSNDTLHWFREILQRDDPAEIRTFLQAAIAAGRSEHEQMDALTTHLIAKRRFRDAIDQLRQFTGLSTIEQRRRILTAAIRDPSGEGWALLDGQMAASPAEAHTLLLAAARIDPDRARPLLRDLLAGAAARYPTLYYRDDFLTGLAECCIRCGLPEEIDRLPAADDPAVIPLGIVNAGQGDPAWERAMDTLLDLYRRMSRPVEPMATLVERCLEQGRQGRARSIVDEARTRVDGKYRDLEQERLLNAQARGGDLTGAWLTLQDIPKGKRSHRCREFIRLCARRGAFDAALDLLSAMPPDINGRIQAAERTLWDYCLL